MTDVAQQIRERLDEMVADDTIGFNAAMRDAAARFQGRDPRTPAELMRDALLAVLKLHRHVRAGDGSKEWLNTMDYSEEVGCVHCHRGNGFGVNALGWCEELLAIADALGIEVADA